MKNEKQKEWEEMLAEHVNEAETQEEWEERVKFASEFSY